MVCVVLVDACVLSAAAFVGSGATRAGIVPHVRRATNVVDVRMGDKDEEPSVLVKGVWFGAEAFGRVAKALRDPLAQVTSVSIAPASLDEAIKRLKADYEGTPSDPRPYFLTGVMDEALYDEDCEFADPFVSFKGRQRFVDNLANLAGGFITESSTRTLSSAFEPGDATTAPSYSTKLLVKLRLGLPWSPVLAWPWGVEHVFDVESGLIVRHIESWDVSPTEGVRQLLTPGGEKAV